MDKKPQVFVWLREYLALDVIAVAQAAEFLLPGRVPDVKDNGPMARVEDQRVHVDTQCCCEGEKSGNECTGKPARPSGTQTAFTKNREASIIYSPINLFAMQ